MKKAFGLPQTLLIMVFVSSIAIMGVRYSKVAVNHYADTYIKEQAQLFMQNAKEWALYEISGHDRSTKGCWQGGILKRNDLLVKKPHVDFVATVKAETYFLLENSDDLTFCGSLGKSIKTPESHGFVQLFITVESKGAKNEIILKDRSIQRP